MAGRLTPAQAELLEMIAEEAAEVVQACTKALRHGLDSRHPDGGPTNAEQLSRELADLAAVTVVAHFSGAVDAYLTDDAVAALDRKWTYTHHQDDAGPQAAAWDRAKAWLGTLSQPAVEEDWMAREGRLAQYGDLDGGLPQSEDHSRRGFEPR